MGRHLKVNRTMHQVTHGCADGTKLDILVEIVKAGEFKVEVLKIITLFAFV